MVRTPRLPLGPLLALLAAAPAIGQVSTPAKVPQPTRTSQPAKPAAPRPKPAPDAALTQRLDTIIRLGCSGAGAAKTRAALQTVLDEQIAFAPLDDHDRFITAAGWIRLCRLAETAKAQDEPALLSRFSDHREFALRLAFLWRPDTEKPKPVMALAERLLTERGPQVDQFPSLAAAICVVFDTDRTWEFGKAPDALDIFDYFVANDAKLLLSTRDTPPELLIYVVDSLVPSDQLAWALTRYAADRTIAKRYAEVPYDRAHFPGGAPLKLASTPAHLDDMLKAGGVCRHQAHYAMHTAKAQGIPSAYVRATGSGVSHAWLGFLDLKGSNTAWNFDSGRFGEYAQMTGTITDPQTRREVSDGRLALLAKAAQEPPEDRRFATAMVDSAKRLADEKAPFAPAPPDGIATTPRENAPALRLALLRAAVDACPAHAPAWDALTDLADAGLLTPDDVTTWADAAVTLCGSDYPDFAVDTLAPLIRSIKDPPRQDTLWTWTYDQFTGAKATRRTGTKAPTRRADLAARVRFEQGELWERAGEPAKAWEAYTDIIDHYANNGPFVVQAATSCEKLLARESKPVKDAADLYARAWGKVTKPSPNTSPEFLIYSNYVRLGARYADLLDDAGKAAEAAKVRKALPILPKKSRT